MALLNANLAGFLVLSLQLLSLATAASAIPSFKFTKFPYAFTHSNTNIESHSTPDYSHPDPGKNPSTIKEEIPDLQWLCPSVYEPRFASQESKFKQAMAKSKRGDLGSYNHIKVDVVWHSVTLDDTELGGFVSDHQIHKSVDILNEHFAPANITFNLTSVNRCKNEGWYKGVGTNNTEAFQMREQTHVGDVKTLNIWTTQIMTNPDGTSAPGGYTAFFPWDKSTGWQHNGIVIRPDVLYGSNHKWFNDGKYLVHEAGHWCGLYHTFAGGCKDEDQVDDTPAQKDPSRVRDEQCVRRRSCPKAPNPDPISNFMDYANPKCPTRFTPGQIKRMREIMKHDRGFPL